MLTSDEVQVRLEVRLERGGPQGPGKPRSGGYWRAERRRNQVSILAATRMLTLQNPNAVSITKEVPCIQ
jgi:hypothetical protein